MQALIAKEKEPITPFIDRVRQLYTEKGISTLLVIGGSGDYFDVADYVLAMDSYNPYDVTEKAHQIARNMQTGRVAEGINGIQWQGCRVPIAASVSARKGRRDVHVKTRGKETILFGETQIDLAAVSQLVDAGQTRAIADALAYAQERYMDGKRPITDIIQQVMTDIVQNGLSCLSRRPGLDYAQFRPHELGAALNRLRTLKVKVS
jgi:predicted ABC-class ATPase